MVPRGVTRVSATVLALLCIFACKKPTSDNAAPTPIIPPDVLAQICRHEPCGGDRPSVNVYRDDKGGVKKLYRMYGACFHSPGLYFEPNGTLVDTIPEQAVLVGSPEANALEERHQRQVKGLAFTDVIRCSDGMRLPPK